MPVDGDRDPPLGRDREAEPPRPAAGATHLELGRRLRQRTAGEQSENQDDLNAKTGSFLTGVELPDGVKIERLAMFANDFSAEDAHVYLVRKQIGNGLDAQFEGYLVLANAKTSGAVDGVMREFGATVSHGNVDNQRYFYFLELVVCDAIEPFAIQVRYT